MKFKQAGAGDLKAIRQLLLKTSLPVEDVDDHLNNFIVAQDGENIIGVVGMQLFGPDVLLRSLAVDPKFRGQGVARELSRRIVALAQEHAGKDFYLLTTTIPKLCEKWGYRKIDRKDVPEAIRNTAEFKGLCPSTAICMHQGLEETA